MSNELTGIVEFTRGSKIYKISYSVNSLIALEKDQKRKINAILKDVSDDPSFELLRSILYFGLKKHHPDITEEEVGDLMSFDNIATMKMIEAIQLAFPTAVKNEGTAVDGDRPK